MTATTGATSSSDRAIEAAATATVPASQLQLGIQTDILQPPAPRTVIARHWKMPNRVARREQTVQNSALIAAGIVIARTKNDGWGSTAATS